MHITFGVSSYGQSGTTYETFSFNRILFVRDHNNNCFDTDLIQFALKTFLFIGLILLFRQSDEHWTTKQNEPETKNLISQLKGNHHQN